jgi:predicted nucleic acid-binding protein
MTRTIVDTGPLVAYCSKNEQHHAWAVRQMQALRPPLLSCEAVLAEADFIARSRGFDPGILFDWITDGAIEIPFRLEEESADVAALLRRYSSRAMQLADACLVRMSEMFRDCRVLTLDTEDFTIYRRFDRQVIPLIAPTRFSPAN